MPTVHQRHGQTDRQTDGRMDGRTTYDSNIALALRASRGKNCEYVRLKKCKNDSNRLRHVRVIITRGLCCGGSYDRGACTGFSLTYLHKIYSLVFEPPCRFLVNRCTAESDRINASIAAKLSPLPASYELTSDSILARNLSK